MKAINANKRRTLRQLLNNKRQEAGQSEFKSIRGYNKLFGTNTNESYDLLDNLLGVVVRTADKGMNELFELYYATRGTNRHFVYIVDDEVIVDRIIEIPNMNRDTLFNWFESGEKWIWRKNTDQDVFQENNNEGKIYSYPQNNNITPQVIKQSYLDGIEHCVFTPIRNWADEMLKNEEITESAKKKYKALYKKLDKLEKIYKDGVPEEKMEEVCSILNVRIYINHLFTNTRQEYGNDLKKQMKIFNLTNTRNHHLDLGILSLDRKTEPVTQQFILDFIDECDRKNTFYYYTKGGDGISSVYTMNESYSVTSTFMDNVKELKEEYGMNFMGIDAIKNPELADFIKRGTHFNTSIKFDNYSIPDGNINKEDYYNDYIEEEEDYKLTKEQEDLRKALDGEQTKKVPEIINFRNENINLEKDNDMIDNFLGKTKSNNKPNDTPIIYGNIDQKKAYYNFKECKYYEGFLGKITDFRKTDKIQGVGLYLIKELRPFNCYVKDRIKFIELNEKMNMYKSNNIYTSAELKFLDTMGWKYKIVAGCWGVETLDFDFGENMLEKTRKKPFVDENGNLKMTGSSMYAMATGCFACDSRYKSYYIRGDEEMYNILKSQSDNELIKFDDINEICIRVNKSKVYTLTHITSFILAYQRLSLIEQLLEMDINKLHAIYVDGIYYKKHDFKMLDTFKEGSLESYNSMNFAEQFITQIYENKPDLDFADKREHYATELWTGPGGCGKTHMNLIDTGLVNLCYVAPSHKLCANKKSEYNVNVMTTQLLLTENKSNVLSRYKNYNGFVLDEVSMMTNDEKEIILDKLKGCKVIMCGDIGFQISAWNGTPFKKEGFDYYNKLTENFRIKKGDKLLEILNQVRDAIENKSTIKVNFPIVDINHLKNYYKREDIILTYSNDTKDQYTKLFPHLNKWYIETSNKHFHGEIFIQDEKPEGQKVVKRHGYTCASVQGETVKHKIWIDSECINNPEVFYTAISRAKEYSQIIIVTNDFAYKKAMIDQESREKKEEELKKERELLLKENKFRCDCCRKIIDIDEFNPGPVRCFGCIYN